MQMLSSSDLRQVSQFLPQIFDIYKYLHIYEHPTTACDIDNDISYKPSIQMLMMQFFWLNII